MDVERQNRTREREIAARLARRREERRQTDLDRFERTRAQMEAWRDSGDPILGREAEEWLNRNGFGP